MGRLRGAVAAGAVVAMLGGATGCGGDDDPGPEAAATTTTAGGSLTTDPLPDLAGHLVFARFDESTHTLVSAHTSAPDGSDEQELPMAEPYGGLRFSHDGRRIAVAVFLEDGRVGTAFKALDGTIERTLPTMDPTLNLYCYVWSPDDAHLGCEGWDDADPTRAGIYQVAAADGSDLTRLTPAGGPQLAAGDYSPDGTVLVVKQADGEDSGPLELMSVDGKGDLTSLGDGIFENAGRFSPDGSRIATSDGHRIIVIDRHGKRQAEIALPGYNLFGPVWSPDGEWLAYSGGTKGPFADIYIARADGSDAHKTTATPDNEIDVDWGR